MDIDMDVDMDNVRASKRFTNPAIQPEVFFQFVLPNHGNHEYQPTPPPPRVITGIIIVVDTNVLLDYLMVIQRFVCDLERLEVRLQRHHCQGGYKIRDFFSGHPW